MPILLWNARTSFRRVLFARRRKIFCRRRRRDSSPERGSGRNPGNRVSRNYRRRNRFRDSLPECTRWNADSPRGSTPIYSGIASAIRHVGNSIFLLKVTFITGIKVARRRLKTILRRSEIYSFTASFTCNGIISKDWNHSVFICNFSSTTLKIQMFYICIILFMLRVISSWSFVIFYKYN